MNGAKVQFEGWHVWIQIAAFTIIFIAFCYFTIRALFMNKDREQKLASMPLNDGVDASEKQNTQPNDPDSTNH
jgi:cbb3-type cytochrome oxidase subunit 3